MGLGNADNSATRASETRDDDASASSTWIALTAEERSIIVNLNVPRSGTQGADFG